MNNDVMIGTWAWGSGYNGSKMIFGKGYDEAELKNTFEKAVELGFLKWDTAAVYGMGRCERLTEEARRTGIRRQGSWEPQ